MPIAHSTYAWQADVDTTVVIPALSLLYLFAVGRFGASRARIVWFAVSMVLLAVAFWTPLHHLGLHYLLLAHLLQNVILAEWAPLFAVLGLSPAMAAALARQGASGASRFIRRSRCPSGSRTTTRGTCPLSTTRRSTTRPGSSTSSTLRTSQRDC